MEDTTVVRRALPLAGNRRKHGLPMNAPDSEEEPSWKWLFLAPCWARTGELSDRPVTRMLSNGAFDEVEALAPPGASELAMEDGYKLIPFMGLSL